MDIDNLRQTLLDENKVKPLIEEGFNAIDKIKRDTGWKQIIPMEQTIADMLEYWRINL